MQPEDPTLGPHDPLDGWAQVYELQASAEQEADDPEPDQETRADDVVVDAKFTDASELAEALARLAAGLDDERDLRARAEEGRSAAEARLRAAEAKMKTSDLEVARLGAELDGERRRIVQLEHDRDEVIHRAEELLTAVRERSDQRLTAELEASRRHWTELLDAERRRVEVLVGERAALLKRLEDAWTASAPERRARPLRPWSVPDDVEDDEDVIDEHAADEGVVGEVDGPEDDGALDGESPELAADIERLRQRLRTRSHRPPELSDVEDGVDRLRESRLEREKEPRRRGRR